MILHHDTEDTNQHQKVLIDYRIAGSLVGRKLGKFGESPVIHQTKTIQISSYNY